MESSHLDEFGREVFSGERITLPIHFVRQKNIHEQIREMILAMKSVEREGFETFEDADDFDVDEPGDDLSYLPSYEQDFDHLPDVSHTEPKETPKEEPVKNESESSN